MVIVPLVFSSIYMSMINLGTPEALGSMGRKAVSYYFVTTVIAVFFGLVFVNIINPGVGTSLGTAGLGGLTGEMAEKVSGQQGLYQTILGVLIDAIPTNPGESIATANILQIIVFAIFIIHSIIVKSPRYKRAFPGSLFEFILAWIIIAVLFMNY